MTVRKPRQVYNELEITALSSDGQGIARREGMVVFVEKTITGDVVDVEVIKKKSGFRVARPIQFHRLSKLRTEPQCGHFGICGGCKWQNLEITEQLKHKHQQVIDALKRIAKVEFPEPARILASEKDYFYRNKLEFTFSDSAWLTEDEIKSGLEIGNRDALGFHIPGRFDKILSIKKCYLQPDPSNSIRLFIFQKAKQLSIPFFNLREQTGVLRTLLVRNTLQSDWMLCLSITEFSVKVKELLEAVEVEFPMVKSIFYAVNTKRNDTLTDIVPQLFSGQSYIEEQMEDLRFRIHPKSFYQTNSKQAYELYKVAREYADLKGNELVYDLYTGTGTIALFIAKMARKVIGIEYVEEAVADARVNMEVNKMSNVEFFAGDMKDILVNEFFQKHGKPDVIITDPPRAGMHESVTRIILQSGAKKIVYISCNPSTQARDIAILDELYKVTAVQPVDMFPHTTHVENIVKLELKNDN